MPKLKAKSVRVIDMLNLISDSEIVLITTNHGRTTYSNYARVIERELADLLDKEIIAVTVASGTLQMFV